MHLKEREEIVDWPATHYVFIERVGPFAQTAQSAWQSLHVQAPSLAAHNTMIGAMALYKAAAQIYRAGFMLASPPDDLPAGVAYERFQGGRYRRFVLTGPYSDLPAASGRVWQIAAQEHLKLRDDFAIEHYVNDPKVTPVEDLVTEILIPVQV
jgi:DNA gyrase inhibitor GyrI